MNDKPQKLNVGKDSVVMGRVTGNVGDGSVVIGPLDDRGNVILSGTMAIGRKARAGHNCISIGANALANAGSITFAQLGSELLRLHDAMQKDPSWSGRQEAVAIEQAAAAARLRDEAAVIRYLRIAGRQTAEFAVGVGASLAATLIVRAMGM